MLHGMYWSLVWSKCSHYVLNVYILWIVIKLDHNIRTMVHICVVFPINVTLYACMGAFNILPSILLFVLKYYVNDVRWSSKFFLIYFIGFISGVAWPFRRCSCHALCSWIGWFLQCHRSKINTYHYGSYPVPCLGSMFYQLFLCFDYIPNIIH